MDRSARNSERGQAFVLLAAAFVVLLGFTALAIDGGMVYADRRRAQNGADAASLAGGSAAALYLENHYVNYIDWSCSDPAVIAAQEHNVSGAKVVAISRAGSNHFAIDEDIGDQHGVTTSCGSFDNGSWIEKYIDVRTMITLDTQTAFAHFVFSGPLRNTVDSIARVRPRSPLVYGNAIVALSDVCAGNEGGVTVDGSSHVEVTGGGIFSNACINANGSVDVDVTNGGITCVGSGCYNESGSPSVSPTPEEASLPLPFPTDAIPPPDCGSLPNRPNPGGSGEIEPGHYSSKIRINNSEALVMKPGLYCLDDGIVVNGGGTLTGSGVTIYVVDGDFDTSGEATVQLTAPPARNCTVCPPAIPGMLIYMAEDNDGVVYMRGTADSKYIGTVFAPTTTIEVGGTADSISVDTQLIGWTIKLHGTSQVNVDFNGEENFQKPAALELFR